VTSDRILVMALLVGLGLHAWRGWAKTPGTPLPHPSIFTAWLIVMAMLGILATFAAPLAAAIAVGLLVALLLGVQNPLVKSTASTGSAP
jgi:hypothetical protein